MSIRLSSLRLKHTAGSASLGLSPRPARNSSLSVAMRFSQTLNSVMTSVRVTLGCAYQLARLLSKHVGDEVMRYIEACERPTLVGSNYISLFLAGSINGAPNWQQRYAGMFEDTDLVLSARNSEM